MAVFFNVCLASVSIATVALLHMRLCRTTSRLNPDEHIGCRALGRAENGSDMVLVLGLAFTTWLGYFLGVVSSAWAPQYAFQLDCIDFPKPSTAMGQAGFAQIPRGDDNLQVVINRRHGGGASGPP